MKCEHCPFVRGYDDGVYCGALPNSPSEFDIPEEFWAEDGCNLRFKEAKKLCWLSDHIGDFQYPPSELEYHYKQMIGELSYDYVPTEKEKEIEDKRHKDMDVAIENYQDYLATCKKRRSKK